MNTFSLQILAAGRPFYQGECESLVLPLTVGQYGIKADHSNVIAGIVPGLLMYRDELGNEVQAEVSDGMVKVDHNEVLVLVETVELPEEIDAHRAELAAERAREELLQKRSRQEYLLAQAGLARATSRLKVSKMRK